MTFSVFGVGDVERRLGFVGDVEAAAVGRDRGAVVHLDVLDLADHLVGRRIDQHDAVAGGVGLDDADGRGAAASAVAGQATAPGQRKLGLHSEHTLNYPAMWLILFFSSFSAATAPAARPRPSTSTIFKANVQPLLPREAAGARPLHHLPLDASTAFRLQPLPAGRTAYTEEESRKNFEAASRFVAARRAAQEPAADDAAGARGRRHRVPPGRQALGRRRTIPSGRRSPTGSASAQVSRAVPLLPARPLHRVRRAEGGVQLALQRIRRRVDQRVPARRSACSTTSSTGISTSSS